MAFFRKISALFLNASIFFVKKLWIFFTALLFIQIGIFYATISEIPIPKRFAEKLFSDILKEEGIRCSIGSASLRNFTVFTAQDIRVDTLGGNEPMLGIRRCAVKLSPGALFDGNWIPRFLYADGVDIYCLSANSVTGRSEKLITDGALISRRESGVISIASARFRAGGGTFVCYGECPGTRGFFGDFGISEDDSSDGNSAAGEKWISVFSRNAGTLSRILNFPEVRAVLDSGSFLAHLSPAGGNAAEIELFAYLPGVEISDRFALNKITATQALSVVPANRRIFPKGGLNLHAESVSATFGDFFSDKTRFAAVGVSVAAQLPGALFSADASLDERLPRRVFVRADRARAVSFRNGVFDAGTVSCRIAPAEAWRFPAAYDFLANAVFGNTFLSAAGTVFASADRSSLSTEYEISLDLRDIFAFPQTRFIAMQNDVKRLRFTESPNLRGNVRFAPGMSFERANVELSAGETTCGERHLRELRVAGTLTPDGMVFPEIRARGSDFLANADVRTQFSSVGDFRVRAWGTIDPSYIDGRLGWFWERIWRDLRPAPSEIRPRADIDVYGNWGEKWEHVFGAIAGENCWGNGVLVDKVRLRVYEDPLMIAAFDMNFERGDDRVKGNMQWHYAMEPDYHYRDFRFLFTGTIPPGDVLRIIGEGLPEALSEMKTSGAGTAVVSGMFSGDPRYYPERMLVNIKGNVPGKFSVFGIEGEDFSGEIFYDNGVVLVGNPFFARADSGSVSGEIRVALPEDGHGADGSKVNLALNLKNVRRSRLADALAAVASHIVQPMDNDEKKSVPAEEEEKTEDLSEIDAVFAGTLTIPDLRSLDASGNFFLRDEDLFELQIFGGFSRLLSAMKIDLTTFHLDRAEGNYTVRDGAVFLPDTRIFGESGEVNVRADVSLPELEIKGEAVFRNLRGTRIPLLGKIVQWGSASTELLPVKISGTLENPEWSVLPTISRIWLPPDDGYGIAPERAGTDVVPEEESQENEQTN